MQVSSVLNGSDFDAGYQLDAGGARRVARGVDAGRRVVIGNADNGKARRAGLEYEIWRRKRAVRRGRMDVKVDQKLDAERGPAAARRLCVRILDREAAAGHVVHEIHLGAAQVPRADRVDQQFHAVGLDHGIGGSVSLAFVDHQPVLETGTAVTMPWADKVGGIVEAWYAGSAGHKALANVLHVAELARQYEASGGISFRGLTLTRRDDPEQAVVVSVPSGTIYPDKQRLLHGLPIREERALMGALAPHVGPAPLRQRAQHVREAQVSEGAGSGEHGGSLCVFHARGGGRQGRTVVG